MQAWIPTATFEALKHRADLLQKIRAFFMTRNVLEVETPILSQHTVTDPYIESFSTLDAQNNIYFLQTSPEYGMKRLLAAGSGPIYQITKAFRKEEQSRFHNPEFTMLEWYQPDLDHHGLMEQVDALLSATLATPSTHKISYREIFQRHLNIDPFNIKLSELKKIVLQHINIDIDAVNPDLDTCLQLLLSHCIEPTLGFDAPVFLYNFPPAQAALARISETEPKVGERFELYIQGVEIANGFHELANPHEQKQRFASDQLKRQQLRRFIPSIDERLIAALEHGLPKCAGVAIGIDRLLMFKTNANALQEVMSFAWENA